MSRSVHDGRDGYALFQPSAYSQGIEPYYPPQPKLWKVSPYGLPALPEITIREESHEQKIGKRAGSIAGLMAGLALNSGVPWLKDRFFLSRFFFAIAVTGLGREIGSYLGKKAGGD
jgi:hypothetical protein